MSVIFDDKIDFMKETSHIPVMLEDVIKYLAPKNGETYIDCTFGAGGYSTAILEKASCKVIGIDQDPDVAEYAEELQRKYNDRFVFWQCNFSQILEQMHNNSVGQVDGVVLDLGVSSMQLDRGERGFSFMHDGPLDMRMSRKGRNAADFINDASEEELARVIYTYGDERDARKIARKIVSERQIEAITTTGRLASIVRSAIGFKKSKIDLSTKTFQAIRIWVNDELGALEKLLSQVEKILKPGGRLVIVSFHSLEDRIAKTFLKTNSAKKVALSKYADPAEKYDPNAVFEILTKKSIKPSVQETVYNPRSRSAKLRAATKINHYAQ
ncbi:MAG: rRNA m(4)C1402 methyltransferase [Rickettsiaceae bacterium]|jgi:16S rRNA (cytosine1402-N4)-methyltransferase|nr:rRNA m(4)C1402 methyltransferase [Rickettsiaceae bacterium]